MITDPLNLANLTDTVRQLMVDELALDFDNGTVYEPKKTLTSSGVNAFPNLLREAFQNGNDATLALEVARYLNSSARSNAEYTLAQGQFNHYYVRAVCAEAGGGKVEVYRARESLSPRHTSESNVGLCVSAKGLLDHLRDRGGQFSGYGESNLKFEPNSGLSVKTI